jgi:S1-C subfamily serine protease
MNKKRVAIIGVIVVVLLSIVSTFFLLPRQPEETMVSEPSQGISPSINLGFTYLQVTPQVSAYYNLGVNSGVLVTEVIPESPAELAGVEVGDVILSYNGGDLKEEAPLFGMMMICPANHRIVMDVWREGKVSVFELTHVVEGESINE